MTPRYSIHELVDESPPDFINRRVREGFIWPGRSVALQIEPKVPGMHYQDLLAALNVLSSWSLRYKPVECDFAIRMTVPGAATLEFELGWGRFL